MLIIEEREKWDIFYRTIAIEINDNRMIIMRNEKLRRYIFIQLICLKIPRTIENFSKNIKCIRANFNPQDYQKWKSKQEGKDIKYQENSVDEKQSRK